MTESCKSRIFTTLKFLNKDEKTDRKKFSPKLYISKIKSIFQYGAYYNFELNFVIINEKSKYSVRLFSVFPFFQSNFTL